MIALRWSPDQRKKRRGSFSRDAWPCVSTGWDGKNKDGLTTASGIYFYQIVSEGFAETRKMILMK